MTKRYILTVPHKYKSGETEKTSYTRVGAVFENTRKESDETFLQIKLDFPVGATELVAFLPNDKDAPKD